jgi:hypothetical protein
VTRADGLRIAQSAGRFHDIIGLNYNAMHGCILGSDPLQREAEFQPLLLVTSSFAQRDAQRQQLGSHPRHTLEGIAMSMQSATLRIEDRRSKIGGRSGGGSAIGSASFQVVSVTKSLSSQCNLSTAARRLAIALG